MTSTLRFGLEMEFHAIRLTLRQRGTNNFWAPAVGHQEQEDTMIALQPILTPVNTANFYTGPYPAPIQWESDWGFRAVGDAHGTFTMANPPGEVGFCVLELATAANLVGDAEYWINSHLCAKAFLAAIIQYSGNKGSDPDSFSDGTSRWYPLQSFLDAYNLMIDLLPQRAGFATGDQKNRFKLQKSPELLAFQNGTANNFVGQNWDAYISGNPAPSLQFVDVQVTYQMSLRTLWTNTDQWINTWAQLWVQMFAPGERPALDPVVGDNGLCALADDYRPQLYAAMWRTAKRFVDTDANFVNSLQGAGVSTPLIKALVMYLLVCEAITPEAVSKNAYPQLPKTSPASIAQVVGNMNGGAALPAIGRLANVNGNPEIGAARTFCTNTLRALPTLVAPPGNLPQTGPQQGDTPFSRYNYTMLRAPPPDFVGPWMGALNNIGPGALTPLNNFGFDAAAPFFCTWARDTNSTVPASTYALPGAGAGAPPTEAKMAFESRVGRSMMNFGFNPYIQDFMFNRSYMSIVRLLGTPADVAAAQAAVNARFPDQPGVVRNTTFGPH